METITRLKQKFSPSNPSASLQKSTQSWADECENDAAVNNTLNFSAGSGENNDTAPGGGTGADDGAPAANGNQTPAKASDAKTLSQHEQSVIMSALSAVQHLQLPPKPQNHIASAATKITLEKKGISTASQNETHKKFRMVVPENTEAYTELSQIYKNFTDMYASAYWFQKNRKLLKDNKSEIDNSWKTNSKQYKTFLNRLQIEITRKNKQPQFRRFKTKSFGSNWTHVSKAVFHIGRLLGKTTEDVKTDLPTPDDLEKYFKDNSLPLEDRLQNEIEQLEKDGKNLQPLEYTRKFDCATMVQFESVLTKEALDKIHAAGEQLKTYNKEMAKKRAEAKKQKQVLQNITNATKKKNKANQTAQSGKDKQIAALTTAVNTLSAKVKSLENQKKSASTDLLSLSTEQIRDALSTIVEQTKIMTDTASSLVQNFANLSLSELSSSDIYSQKTHAIQNLRKIIKIHNVFTREKADCNAHRDRHKERFDTRQLDVTFTNLENVHEKCKYILETAKTRRPTRIMLRFLRDFLRFGANSEINKICVEIKALLRVRVPVTSDYADVESQQNMKCIDYLISQLN